MPKKFLISYILIYSVLFFIIKNSYLNSNENNKNSTSKLEEIPIISNSNDKKNINIWGDYINLPELLVYYYNITNQNNQLKLKNINSIYLDNKNILEISPPISISKNPFYKKLQITLPENYLNSSKCNDYKLKDFSYVSLKNCTFELIDSNEILITRFDMIILNMELEKKQIRQIMIENNDIKNKIFFTYPSYIENKVEFKECKQSYCSDLKNNSTIFDTIYEPLFGKFNFQINFKDLKEYEIELFRVFMIVRNKNNKLDNTRYENTTKTKEEINNEISFFSDITKVITNKENNFQINLETFPEVFDLKLIYDIQRRDYDLILEENLINKVNENDKSFKVNLFKYFSFI
jgi:hypothetical protein